MGQDDLRELSLKKFKLKDIAPASTVLLIGARGSGKTFLLRDILYENKQIPMGLIFSGTEEANRFFGDFFPDTFIHGEYKPELIESSILQQKKKVSECKKLNKGNNGCTPDNRFLCVLDDMLYDAQNWKKEKTMKNIFFNGRHYNIFFILTMQYPLGIPPELRGNIDYVFIFNEPSIKNRKKIYEDYVGMVSSMDHFSNILDSCTENYGCLVVKRTSKSTKLQDQIFWYKARDHPPFRVGHPKLWKFHEMNYNAKYEEQEDILNERVGKLKKKYDKTRKLKILVNRQNNSIVQAQEISE